MNRFSAIPLRLIIEILSAVAAAEVFIFLALPLFGSSLQPATILLLNLACLAGVALLVILLRRRAAKPGPGTSRPIRTPRAAHIAFATIAAGLACSLLAARHERNQIEAQAAQRFSVISQRAFQFLTDRFRNPPGLFGARGLYAASDSVEPDEFAVFIANRNLSSEFPDTPILGAMAPVAPEEVSAYQERIRTLGSPAYTARPRAGASLHLLVQHAEPATRAGDILGEDLSGFPGLLEDLDACIDLDQPRLTVASTLDFDDAERQYSLWILPIFHPSMPQSSPADRRAALQLVLFAPIHTAAVAEEIISHLEGLADVEVFEGDHPSVENILLDADGHLAHHTGPITASSYEGRSQVRSESVRLGGRIWTVNVTSLPRFEATIDRSAPPLIALVGSLVSILLGSLLWSMGTARSRAESIARSMTSELTTARDHAEKLLREARGLRDAIEQQAIYSETDPSGRITDVNQKFCEISGYTREEVLGKTHAIINSGTHPRAFWTSVWRTISAGNTWRGEVCNRAKNGRFYWVDSIIAPFKDASGNIERFVSIRFDISEAKRSQAAVAASEARFRTLVESTNVVVWEFDVASNRFTYVSPQAARFGFPLADWLKPNFWQDHLLEPDRDEAIKYCFSETLAGRDHRLQYRMRCADGSIVHIDDVVTVQSINGHPVTMRGVLIDITDQIHQRQAFRIQADRLDLTVRSANLGTWDWNIVTGEVMFNDIIQAMVGYQPGEWEPHVRSWESLVHPDDMPNVRNTLTEHLEGRTPEYRCEHRLRRKDGTWAWILDTGRVTERDASGKPLRAMGVHVDVTPAHEAAERLREAQAQADAANRAKSEFLANMSHEIRTPMTAILGFADLLTESESLPASSRADIIHTIKRNGDHLLSIINDILDVSKIEAGKMTAESLPLDPLALLREVESLMAVKAGAKGIDFSLSIDSPLPAIITTDPVRLRQILVNLVGNAIKFTERGGVTIRARLENPSLVVRIEDTGIGMSIDQVTHIFEAFMQADSSTTRRFGGSGLGLHISKSLATLLGGDVTVESHPGHGSTFTLTIPIGTPNPHARPVPLAPRTEPAAMGDTPLAGARILLAEDGPDNQRLIAFHLKKAGATVVTCDNGRMALEALTSDHTPGGPLSDPTFDLIITDIQMPELDGYSLTRALRAKGWNRPIIALTAHAMQGDADRCLDAGCDAYISKPIDRVKLIEACAAARSAA